MLNGAPSQKKFWIPPNIVHAKYNEFSILLHWYMSVAQKIIIVFPLYTFQTTLQVDHWMTFAQGSLSCASKFSTALTYLDKSLEPVTYIVGQSLTLADFAIWEILQSKWLGDFNMFILVLVSLINTLIYLKVCCGYSRAKIRGLCHCHICDNIFLKYRLH